MGRHSASYVAAQQRALTGPTSSAAAKYVGRVGALALAMGVGAAVVGGAGLAQADDTTDNGTGGAERTRASAEPAAAKDEPSTTSTDESSGVKTRRPNSSSVSETSSVKGGETTDPAPDGEADPDADPDSPTGLISGNATEIAAELGDGRSPAAKSPTHVGVASQDTPPEDDRPSSRTAKDRQATPAGPGATPVRAATDDLAATAPGPTRPLAAATSPPVDTNRQQQLSVSPSATAPPVVASGVAASPQPARAPATPRLANPIATVVSGLLGALGLSPSASTGGAPVAPMPLLLGALQLVSRELERIFMPSTPSTVSFTTAETFANANPAMAPGVPSPGDEAQTAYGDIGTWQLQPNGQIANYGGVPFKGKTVLEPVNVIIVDPTSKSPAEATRKLNAAMFRAGFPAQPIHSGGFRGTIDDVTYGQQPTTPGLGYSDNLFLVDNNHGRIFGPDPVETSTGYVWSGAFSTETLVIHNFLLTHGYVSSDVARAALAKRLILSGQARFVGMVPLNNAYNTGTTTTGDHDGYAVALQLN